MISKLNTVALYVADQERSRAFYVDVLGFEVRTDAEMGPMGRWLEVAPPGAETAFVLSDAAKFDRTDRIGTSRDVTLSCDDVFALHKSLTDQGIDVAEPEKQGWGTFMRITDPDGHTFVVSS